jgi:hypothetical protein
MTVSELQAPGGLATLREYDSTAVSFAPVIRSGAAGRLLPMNVAAAF